MSKVLKSSAVNIQVPVTIETFGEDLLASTAEEGLFTTEEEQAPEDITALLADAKSELERVQKKTNEVLAETEEMVKELLETARTEAEKVIRKAREEAEMIRNDAEQQKEQILKEANEEREKFQQEGYNNGHSDGLKEGTKQALASHAAMLEEAQNIVELAHEERKQILINSETEIVQLALAVARKVICQEVTINHSFIVEVAKKAIQKATDREEITVKVNSEHLDDVLGAKDDILQSTKGIKSLKVVSDPLVEPGGCVVDTPNGSVDARVERQLSEIEQSMMEVGPHA